MQFYKNPLKNKKKRKIGSLCWQFFGDRFLAESSSLAEEAAKRSQELTNGISFPSKLSDVVSEASKCSMEIATEASRKSKEIVAEALKRADQIKSQIHPAAMALSSLVDVNSPPVALAVSRADLEKFGVTNDLRDFVKGITLNTFYDFSIEGCTHGKSEWLQTC